MKTTFFIAIAVITGLFIIFSFMEEKNIEIKNKAALGKKLCYSQKILKCINCLWKISQ